MVEIQNFKVGGEPLTFKFGVPEQLELQFEMSLLVQCILCFLLAISVASNVPDVSIAEMADDLLSSEQQQQFAVTNDIKEWTIDWHSDFEEVRSSLMAPGPSIDAKKLLEDILCGKSNIIFKLMQIKKIHTEIRQRTR